MAKTTGAIVIADMLKAYEVTHVFMVPAVLRRTFAEMEFRTHIARIHTHGEKSAAYMADGYARASGKPGICMAQVVGALNLAAGLRDAHLAQSPVIAFTGGREAKTNFRKLYQEVDDLPAFEPVTKWNATVDAVERIPDMIRQAFRVATSGAPGPVHLQFRGNEGQIDTEEADMEAYCEPQFAHVPPFRPEPESHLLEPFLELLRNARRPVIVAGGGARASRAHDALRSFAEKLQIPVATSLNAKDILPSTHPLAIGVVGSYSRETTNLTVNQADLVCFIGTEAGGMTTHIWQVPKPGTAVVQIDINPAIIGRNYPLKASLCGDARATLERLLAQNGDRKAPDRTEWLREADRLRKQWYEKYDAALKSDAQPIRPERLCHELSLHTPDDALIVVDTGHAGMWMGGMFDLRTPRQGYVRSGGHLGWAFPAGLGAKCAQPDRPVIVFTGDAGFWYHIGEIETAVRWGIHAVIVVNNNGGGNQSKRGFDRAYGGTQTERGRELWTYTKVDFAKLAESVGAVGIRVTDPSQFESALDKAVSAKAVVIIDVVTDIEAIAPPPVA